MGKKKKKAVPDREPDFLVYTDGGCAVNPGGPGGIGVVITDTRSGEYQEISQGYFSTTNNRMEIMAIIAALETIPDGAGVQLYSDSQYAINCLCGVWRRNTNIDLWKRLDAAPSGKALDLRWVRGHSGDDFNERCDELATDGLRSPSLVDAGYADRRAEGREFYEKVDRIGSGGAMAVPLAIPDDLSDPEPEIESPAEFAKHHGIHTTCARAILDFYLAGNRSFKAYVRLKTGGIDSYSRKSPETLSALCERGSEVLEIIRVNLPDEKMVSAAMRWYVRGLTVRDSIRKVLVDQEVADNCIRS